MPPFGEGKKKECTNCRGQEPPVVEPLVMADHPLQAKIEAGQLVIRIGVKRLADCSTGDDLGALHGRKITDPEEFCEDVIREMMIEDEQGTTPLIAFLGEMEIAAFESGSLAVEPQRQSAPASGAQTVCRDWL